MRINSEWHSREKVQNERKTSSLIRNKLTNLAKFYVHTQVHNNT